MRKLFILLLLAVLAACSPPVTQVAITEIPSPIAVQPTETFRAVCTPPACSADEAYFCPGNCPGGCGTVCATVTPEAALNPLVAVLGAGEWIVRTQDNLAFLDPGGTKPGFTLQRVYAPLMDYILVGGGNVYSLTDSGDGSLTLNRIYPNERWLGNLDTKRNVDGSMRTAPIFSADGKSLVWGRAEVDGSLTRAVFVTALESGESREVWRTELPAEVAGHALVSLFYNDERQSLVYALHMFYSGMTPSQVASLYLADLSADKITPLWEFKSDGIYAGVSATVSADGGTLAYLTWGEPQPDFSLPWTLHLRDLTNGKETEQHLSETWENAEVHLFAPDGKSLALTASRHTADGGFISNLLIFDLQKQTWASIYSTDFETKPFLLLRAWSNGNWLILTSDVDNSTWVMRPDGQALTQVTPLEWIGMLQR